MVDAAQHSMQTDHHMLDETTVVLQERRKAGADMDSEWEYEEDQLLAEAEMKWEYEENQVREMA